MGASLSSGDFVGSPAAQAIAAARARGGEPRGLAVGGDGADGAVGADAGSVAAISVKLGGSGELTQGAYEAFILREAGVAGGDEATDLAAAKEATSVEDAVLQYYATSPAAKGKAALIAALKKAAASLLNMPNVDEDKVLEVFLAKLPDPRKPDGQFRADAATHEKLCRLTAKAVNEALGAELIPAGAAPEQVCRMVVEVLYSLQRGLQGEFLVVYTNTRQQLANLRALSDAMEELVKRAEAQVAGTDQSREKEAALEALEAAKLVKQEADRQLGMLSSHVEGALGQSAAEVETLVDRRKKLFQLVEKLTPLRPGSTGFSRTLAAAMRGLADSALMAAAVSRALKQAHMSISDYVAAKSPAELQDAIDRLVRTHGSEAEAIRLAGETLRKYHGMRQELSKEARGGDSDSEAGEEPEEMSPVGMGEVEGGDAYPENKELSQRLKRQDVVLDSITRSFVAKFDATFKIFVATVDRLSKKMSSLGANGVVETTEALDAFRTAMLNIKDIAYPGAIQALLGYVTSVNADQMRNTFTTSLETASTYAKALAEQPSFGSLAGELRELASSLESLVQTVRTFRAEVLRNFGPVSITNPVEGQAEGGDDVAKFAQIPPTALSRIERPLQLAMNRSADKLGVHIDRLQYYIELAFVRDDFRRVAAMVGESEEKAVSINAKAIGAKVEEIRQELKARLELILKDDGPNRGAGSLLLEHVKDTQRGAAGFLPDDDENCGPAAANKLKEATGKMVQQLHSAKANLYRALESFDHYMRAFSGAVLKHPDALSNLEQLFNPARAARQWYSPRTGAHIASVFECFPATTTEDAQGMPLPVYLWAALDDTNKPVNFGRGAEHYYQRVQNSITAPPAAPPNPNRGALPGNPYAAIPAIARFGWKAGHDDMRARVREVFSGMIVLKNLISAFFQIGDQFGGESLKGKSLLSPTQMYDFLVTYLEVSAATLRDPKDLGDGFPGGAGNVQNRGVSRLIDLDAWAGVFKADRLPGRNNLAGGVQGWGGVGNDAMNRGAGNGAGNAGTVYTGNAIVFAGTVAPGPGPTPSFSQDQHAGVPLADNHPNRYPEGLVQMTVAMSSVFPQLGNMFADSDEYFYRIMRGMAAKVMAVMGLHVMLERPDQVLTVNPVRAVLGAAEGGDAAEIIPEATTLYIYGIFALEFFKDLLGVNNTTDHGPNGQRDLGAKVALIPDFEGDFAPLLTLMFMEMRGQDPRSGAYSDAQLAAIIRELNKLYDRHRSAGAQAPRNAVFDLVKEINRRMALLTTEDITHIDQAINRRSNLPPLDIDPDALIEDVEVLPDEGELQPARSLPSDQFAQGGPADIPGAAADQRNKLRGDDAKIINRLRRHVDGQIIGQNAQQKEEFKFFLRDMAADIKELPDNQKRFEMVASIVRSRDYAAAASSSRALLAFHEAVTTPLTALNALLGHAAEFAQQALEHDALGFDQAFDKVLLNPPAAAQPANWLFGLGGAGPAPGDGLYNQCDATSFIREHQQDGLAKGVTLNAVKFGSSIADVGGTIVRHFTYPNYEELLRAIAPAPTWVMPLVPAHIFPFGDQNAVVNAAPGVGPAHASLPNMAAAPAIQANDGLLNYPNVNNARGWSLLEGTTAEQRKDSEHFAHIYYEALKFVLLNREGLLMSLVDTVGAFANDSQGLVEVSITDRQMFLDASKYRDLCKELLKHVKDVAMRFRPFIPSALLEPYLNNTKPGSLFAAEELYEKLFVRTDATLPESRSLMAHAGQVLADNFAHAIRPFKFNMEAAVAVVVTLMRAANQVAGAPNGAINANVGGELRAPAVLQLLKRDPGAFPYRFLLPALSFYPVLGPALVNHNQIVGGVEVGANLMRAEPQDVWRMLGTVRTAAALATPVRSYKRDRSMRAQFIDRNMPVKETPFLAINQLVLDALDAVYDQTAEKMPRSIVSPFIDKLSGIISDEKNSFPDACGPTDNAGAEWFQAAELNAQQLNQLVAANNELPAGGLNFLLRADAAEPASSPLAPKASQVLFNSLAAVLRNAYYNNDTAGKRVNVWETAEEVPEHVKERARAHLPRTHHALGLARQRVKLLQALLNSKLTTTGKAIPNVRFYNQAPVTMHSAAPDVGSAVGLHAAQGANLGRDYFSELYRSLDTLAAVAQQAIAETLEAFGKPSQYFEEFAGSALASAQTFGRKPHSLLSGLLLLTLPATDRTAFTSSGIGTPEFKLAYGTAALFDAKGVSAARFPAAQGAIAQANAVLPSSARLADSATDGLFGSYLRAVRYLAELNLFRKYMTVRGATLLSLYNGGGESIAASPFARQIWRGANNAVPPNVVGAGLLALINGPNALPAPHTAAAGVTGLSLRVFYQAHDAALLRNVRAVWGVPAALPNNQAPDRPAAAYPIDLANGEFNAAAGEKLLALLLSTRSEDLRAIVQYLQQGAQPAVLDRSQLWARTFLALRIVPIQPTILSREIPLATTYNWDYAFSQMLVELVGKYDKGAADRWRAVTLAGDPRGGQGITSPADALLVSLLDPNYPGITKAEYERYFARMLLGDDSLPMSRPKMLSDSLHNGALLGNTYSRDAWPERYGDNAPNAVVDPRAQLPPPWVAQGQGNAAIIAALVRGAYNPRIITGPLVMLLRRLSPNYAPGRTYRNVSSVPTHASTAWARPSAEFESYLKRAFDSNFDANVIGDIMRADPADPNKDYGQLLFASTLSGYLIQRDLRQADLSSEAAYVMAAFAVTPQAVPRPNWAPADAADISDNAVQQMIGASRAGIVTGNQAGLEIGGDWPSSNWTKVGGAALWSGNTTALMDAIRRWVIALNGVGGNRGARLNNAAPLHIGSDLPLAPPPAPPTAFISFGIVDPQVFAASDLPDAGAARTLYYPERDTGSHVTRDNLQAVELGQLSGQYSAAAYVRSTTTFVRKLVFLANLQRMLFHKIQTEANHLGKSRVIQGLVIGDQRVTDFRGTEHTERPQ